MRNQSDLELIMCPVTINDFGILCSMLYVLGVTTLTWPSSGGLVHEGEKHIL